jgi:hypothetical protein
VQTPTVLLVALVLQCTRSLVFCVVCRSLFVLILLAIKSSVLRFTAYDYPFDQRKKNTTQYVLDTTVCKQKIKAVNCVFSGISHINLILCIFIVRKVEDIKGVIISCKSKDRRFNGQKNKDKQ